jgi:hypothetical protein
MRKSKSLANILKEKVHQQNIMNQSMSQFNNYIEGNSLIIFGPHNTFRIIVTKIVRSP